MVAQCNDHGIEPTSITATVFGDFVKKAACSTRNVRDVSNNLPDQYIGIPPFEAVAHLMFIATVKTPKFNQHSKT